MSTLLQLFLFNRKTLNNTCVHLYIANIDIYFLQTFSKKKINKKRKRKEKKHTQIELKVIILFKRY